MPDESDLKQQAIATMASAIIAAKGYKDLHEIAEALEDARFLLYPDPKNTKYAQWRKTRGANVPDIQKKPPLKFTKENLASLESSGKRPKR